MPLSKKIKRTITILLKGTILVLAFGFIYNRVTDNKNLHAFGGIMLKTHSTRAWITIAAVAVLMFVNWFLEAVKWRFLVTRIERISLWTSVESVFCGLTWAIFTPNRVGEYGGRVLFLSPRKRISGVMAMVVGGAAQVVLTNVLGGLSLIWFIGRFIPLSSWLHYAITFVIMVFCAFFTLFYFNIRLLNNFLQGIRFLKRFHRFFKVLTYYKMKDLGQIFWLSCSRFAVFTLQYYLMIHLLVPEIGAHEIVLMVFIILFVQSSLPSMNLLDVGIRGMTATYFFGYVTHQEISILACSAFIWLVNLIIPAILGAVFVLKLKFFDSSHR